MRKEKNGARLPTGAGLVGAAGAGRRLHNALSIQSKFLVGTGLILLFNCLITALIIYHYEKEQLEEDAYASSELVMAAVDASRSYVREELRPVIAEKLGGDYFIPQAMSTSFVGRAVMERFAQTAGEFEYRRVAVNARNPAYEANKLEQEVLDFFRDNPDQEEWRGLVKVAGEKRYKRFRPDYFTGECLWCHGRPEDAPPLLLEMYGDSRGFGRQDGELAGLVTVDVPVAGALAQARENAFAIFWVVFAGMALVFIALSFFFHRTVVTNLRGLLEIFQDHDLPDSNEESVAIASEADGETKGWRDPEAPRRFFLQRDEMVELTEAALTMAAHLRRTREQLRLHALELERRVEERTEELRRSEARLREKELAEKIRHTEKLVAMGQMMAGLAHEINNPLGVMLCYLDLVKREAADHPQLLRDLEVIEKQTRGCKQIVSDLLAFARSGESRRQPGDLNRIIREVAEMVAPQFGKQGLEVELDLAADLPPLWLDDNRLRQVFLNLLMNARQAMVADGGLVRIVSRLEAAAGRVRVRVEDNGRGIDPVIHQRIFEPFFSTKATGEGTGLGLAVSYGIIKEHGGEIGVESREGEGSCFIIDLPLAAAAQPVAAESGEVAVAAAVNEEEQS